MASNSIIINPAITGSIPTINFTNTNSNTGNIDLTATGTLEVCSGASAGNLSLKTNNTDRVYILNNGNVGIGKTNPAYILDVNGLIRTNSALLIGDTNNGNPTVNTITHYFPTYYGSNSSGYRAIEIGPYSDNMLISTGCNSFIFYVKQTTMGNPAGTGTFICAIDSTNGFVTNNYPISSGSGNIITTGKLSIARKVSGFQKKIWNANDLGFPSNNTYDLSGSYFTKYYLIATDLSLSNGANIGILTLKGYIGAVNGGIPAILNFDIQICTRGTLYVSGYSSNNVTISMQNPMNWFDFVVTPRLLHHIMYI